MIEHLCDFCHKVEGEFRMVIKTKDSGKESSPSLLCLKCSEEIKDTLNRLKEVNKTMPLVQLYLTPELDDKVEDYARAWKMKKQETIIKIISLFFMLAHE